MALVNPSFEKIDQLRVPPTEGEFYLLQYLAEYLHDNGDNDYRLFYEPYINGSRPDLIILKKGCGAIIIEVKDWDLSHYHIDENNRWLVVKHTAPIRSPMKQAFSYKNQLFNLHLPVLGLESISDINKNFFGTIHPFSYFHNATSESLNNLYDIPLRNIQLKINELNNRRRNNQVLHHDYIKHIEYLERKKKQLKRDRNLTYTRDKLKDLVSSIKSRLQPSPIFSDNIFEDFHRRLLPPDFILTQNIDFRFDNKQQKVAESNPGFSKVKGVAGCGKTTLLAAKAINAYLRLNTQIESHELNSINRNRAPAILILTFNITLCNYIKDTINKARKGADILFTILNYHNFFMIQANEYKINLTDLIWDQLFKTNVFEDAEIPEGRLYDTILIDEVQDFEPSWIKIIRDNFLKKEGGEMVLFGDQSQNIYKRDEMNKRNSPIVQGFGRWIELKKSYRFSTNSPLIGLFQKFQIDFLMSQYQDSLIMNSEDTVQESLDLNNDILRHITVPTNNEQFCSEFIFSEIKSFINIFKIHPNDLTILASRIDILKEIEALFAKDGEKTEIMFETKQEEQELREKFFKIGFYQKIKEIRRMKKTHFYQNPEAIKISTIHSYKGFESKSVFYIMLPEDLPELIYTSITRAKNDLYIFDLANNEYSQFFANNISNQTIVF